MKQLYKLIAVSALFLGFNNAGAQVSSRIVSSQTDKHDGTSWQHYDSSRYIFNWGNNNPGDASTIYSMQKDTTIALFYNASMYYGLYKHAYTYDAQGRVIQHLWLTQSPPLSGNWINYQNVTYTYDANGNMLSEKTEEWDNVNNAWKNMGLDSRYYTNNKLMKDSIKFWDATLSVWYYNSANTYSYSGDTTFRAFDTHDYATHTWSHYSRYILVYDANNNNTFSQYDQWYSWLNNYRPYYKTIYVYNANNQQLSYTNQMWDTVANAFVNSDRNVYAYNASYQLVADSAGVWNTTTNSWDATTAIKHIMDSVNHTDTAIGLKWDAATSSFVNDVRRTGTFNSYYQITSGITEHWNTLASAWQGANNDYSYKYYYELVNLAVPSVAVNKPQVMLFPSPANTVVNLSVNWEKATSFSVAVIDIQGRILKRYMEHNIKDYKSVIPVADLPAGNYNVIISSGAVTTSERFTIMK